ncbi:MAG: DNA (cytosine-5-)-methyltransferase [Alphaproteobacteria bacterium]|nr:DNA (cytosine-5-)-methyltransferase [Alphaproteobacteria bacterium]
MKPTYYEFFAGGGMASIGLGAQWRCLLANDIDPVKAAAYRDNHPGHRFVEGDIAQLTAGDLPGVADLAWASFPCQDLSLAGKGGGLSGARSGVFWSFERLMRGLVEDGRSPRLIAIENVIGLMTSNGGRDLETAAAAVAALGYRVAMFTLDAAHFLPQSRPRLFMIGMRNDVMSPTIASDQRSEREARAVERLMRRLGPAFVDIRPPAPPRRNTDLVDIIDWRAPTHPRAQTETLLGLMAPLHRARVEERRLACKGRGERAVGAVYRRMRTNVSGGRVQRAEVRFDGLAGCLRTPAGGSSRQTLLLIEKGEVRSRLITSREAAALMGLPDGYLLPDRYNDAYKLCGDGVAAPVVRWIAATFIEPILAHGRGRVAA